MQNEIEILEGIMEELFSNALRNKAKRIAIVYEDLGSEVMVKITDNGEPMPPEELRRVKDLLNQPRRIEIEDYYGHLAGDWMAGNGLSLVGMMVNRAEISTEPGGGTTITVYRKK